MGRDGGGGMRLVSDTKSPKKPGEPLPGGSARSTTQWYSVAEGSVADDDRWRKMLSMARRSSTRWARLMLALTTSCLASDASTRSKEMGWPKPSAAFIWRWRRRSEKRRMGEVACVYLWHCVNQSTKTVVMLGVHVRVGAYAVVRQRLHLGHGRLHA